MVLQVMEKKQREDKISDENFESKFLISNGNYVKFEGKVISIFKNVDEESPKTSSSTSKTLGFYDIINNDKSSSSMLSLKDNTNLAFWIDNKDLTCSCPKLRLRRKYLMMSKSSNLLKYLVGEDATAGKAYDTTSAEESGETDSAFTNGTSTVYKTKRAEAITAKVELGRIAGLLVDRETIIIEWRRDYARRLKRFYRLFKKGKCL